MKMFFFTLIACVALMRGVCEADPSAPASKISHSESPKEAKQTVSANGGKQMEGKPPDEKDDDRRKSIQNDVQTKAGTSKSNTQLAPYPQKQREESAANHNPFRNILSPHRSAVPKNVASTGPSKTNINRPPPARPASVVPLGGPSFNSVRNRTSGLTTIGGPVNEKYGTTAAITGTGVYHKP